VMKLASVASSSSLVDVVGVGFVVVVFFEVVGVGFVVVVVFEVVGVGFVVVVFGGSVVCFSVLKVFVVLVFLLILGVIKGLIVLVRLEVLLAVLPSN
jgi:hypothetical protein